MFVTPISLVDFGFHIKKAVARRHHRLCALFCVVHFIFRMHFRFAQFYQKYLEQKYDLRHTLRNFLLAN